MDETDTFEDDSKPGADFGDEVPEFNDGEPEPYENDEGDGEADCDDGDEPEDDGQPSEWTEWQDVFGGDDNAFDHGGDCDPFEG